MEQEKVRRGIDFTNRVGEGRLSETYRKSLNWWKGGKLNKRTFVFIGIIYILNFIIVYPLFWRNVTGAYTSSAILMLIADILHKILFIKVNFFFTFITFIALTFSPVTFYLFVRKLALRHELTAFIATLLFILPNPIFDYTPAIGASIIYGDGPHVLVFAFLPLFLLYVESFLSTGLPVLALLTAVGTGIISIISPFMMFNLFIIYPVLTVAEGFMGNLRIKLLRMLFLFVSAGGLSLFWYFPNFFSKGIQLSHVVYAINKTVSLFPLLIPIIPVFGALFFLVFDRRSRLKPIFVGVSLLVLYLMMYRTSYDVMMGGIFTPERYHLEISFAGSITMAILLILTGEIITRNIFLKSKKSKLFIFMLIMAILVSALMVTAVILSVHASRIFLALEPMHKSQGVGLGNLVRIFRITDIPSLLMDFVSLLTFLALIRFAKVYPSAAKKLKS